MEMMESPSLMLDSRLATHTERHSLRSGVPGSQVARPIWLGSWLRMQRHRAWPVVPPGHGWMAVSPSCVQFQLMLRAVAGAQYCSRSFSQIGSCAFLSGETAMKLTRN